MLNLDKFLSKYYGEDDPIILACSTGPDSMYLLYKILETKYAKNLVACYFNHKTRPETDREEEFLENLWKEKWFKVEVANCDFEKIKKLYPSISFEELAREKRYHFFDTIMQIYKSKNLLTAHHLDDKIETFFFNLLRWSKLSGFINMTEEKWAILRPLLSLTKKEIEDYLKENNFKYNIDETNFNTEITRNFLRHDIIPKLWKINSKYKQNISNTLDYFEDLSEFIDLEITKFLWDNRFFNIEEFNNLSKFLQKEVIRYIYFTSNWNSTIWLSEANIKEVIRFINWKNNKTVKEIKNMKMKKDNKIILF